MAEMAKQAEEAAKAAFERREEATNRTEEEEAAAFAAAAKQRDDAKEMRDSFVSKCLLIEDSYRLLETPEAERDPKFASESAPEKVSPEMVEEAERSVVRIPRDPDAV